MGQPKSDDQPYSVLGWNTSMIRSNTRGNGEQQMSAKLVTIDHVSKKFCRSLRKSLWYGVKDITADMFRPARSGQDRAGGGTLRDSEFWALDDVSFELRRGECLGLIGRNGAGKTTMLKMLTGLMKPDGGRITMRGSVGALIALG